MIKIRWPEETKLKARTLRKQNLSFNTISRQLGISKSTLHSWISDLKRPEYITRADKLRHLINIRPLAQKAIRDERQSRLDVINARVDDEVKSYSTDDIRLLRSMLTMLYWAEGAKGRGMVNFANTDPALAKLFIILLRRCYPLDESKFRVRLHLHSYHNIDESKKFWSSLLEIPESKFGKMYIKPRSVTKRFRENFAGICFIRYHSEALRYELLQLGRTLGGKICEASARSSSG